jgi:hypothetical protein
MGLPKTLKGWALAGMAATWSLFFGVIVVGFLTAWATQLHLFDDPGGKVTAAVAWLAALFSSALFAWPAGLFLGASAGFAVGVWLDAFLRRRDTAPLSVSQQINPSVVVPQVARADEPSEEETRAKLEPWRLVDKFTVEEAACLWGGILPGVSFLYIKEKKPSVTAAERLITSELRDKLDTTDAALHVIGDYSKAYVSRAALRALAERKNVRPSFLYLDDDPPQPQAQLLMPHAGERISKTAYELYEIVSADMQPLVLEARRLAERWDSKTIDSAQLREALELLSEKTYHGRKRIRVRVLGSFDEARFAFLMSDPEVDGQFRESMNLYVNGIRELHADQTMEVLRAYNYGLIEKTKLYEDWIQKALSRLKEIGSGN